jgi:translation initiation factor IF-2
MTDGNERNDTPPSGRKPLTLSPRPQSAGTVKQSFSHGRTKQVDVVIKPGKRPGAAPGAPPAGSRLGAAGLKPAAGAEPSAKPAVVAAAKPAPRPAGAPARPEVASAQAAPAAASTRGLSQEEQRRRQEAIARAAVDGEARQALRREEEERERARLELARARREEEEQLAAEQRRREEEERIAAGLPEPEPEPEPEPIVEAALELQIALVEEVIEEAAPAGPKIGTPGPVLRSLRPAPKPEAPPARPAAANAGRGDAPPANAGNGGNGANGNAGAAPRQLTLADIARVKTKATPLPVAKPAKPKGEPKRREGRLTLEMVERMQEGDDERGRSIAALRRAREKERERRIREMRGGDQAKVTREVIIPETISVQDLANRMATRAGEIIKHLMREGTIATLNHMLDADTAELIAVDFGHTVKRVSDSDIEDGLVGAVDEEGDLEARPPVVTVMGHVDHGKTSLLDALRHTDVAAGEAGGITQHIGAYQVRLANGQRVTFLDTPGHAAFSGMRARGAQVTDIVVLVVAADDGVMPQTIEAISHAKAAGVPIIVAVNKIDKPDANPQKVINELLQYEIVTEANGGDVQAVSVSATKKMGLDDLVEAILLQSEVLELKANPKRAAEAVVIESKLDRGRGSVATVLVQRGTLKRGDIVIAGAEWGRVRALVNERGQQLAEAGPSEPVEIMGLEGVPAPGDKVVVVESEARAREVTAFRQRRKRDKIAAPNAVGRASFEQLMAKAQDKTAKELPVVLRADVQGSAEAISTALEKLGTDEIRAKVLQANVGAINEADVTLAKASGAPIIGFNVRASKEARELAEREGVEIRYYAIIYDVIDDVKGVMSGMLSPIQRETFLGTCRVLEVFQITKVGRVAGCLVQEGKMQRGARIRLLRDNVVIHEGGKLNTLKRFKDDVNEVQSGQECGMSFENYQDIKQGDVVECYLLETVQRTL